MSFLSAISARLFGRYDRSVPRRTELVSRDGALYATNGEETRVLFEWGDVKKVVAFKRDLFSIDLVCVEFEIADGTFVKIDEDMDNFTYVREEMMQRFPAIDPRWFEAVVTTAFATNYTVLYDNTG